jgi:ketosteroid isomerase-like protein
MRLWSSWQAFFDLGIAGAQPETLEVIPMGEYALEVGEYSLYGDDETLADRGKIMVLWKNEDGTWKMHRDTWNSSLPQTPPVALSDESDS